jgi:hypothetical protein
MEYDNLREKTIFDFTRDKKILENVLSESTFVEFLETPNEIVEESKDWQRKANFVYILAYARETNNQELFDALKKEFTEYSGHFWKQGDAWIIN